MKLTAPKFDESEIELLRACLDSGWVTQGPMTRRFEELIAARHGVKHALATTSCTAALHLAATALGLKAGDEVVVPAFTWVTSAHCAEYVGARAVFADIDLATYNLDPAALAAAITPRTKAVVAVHLFGLAAPMDEILSIARRHDLVIIEDAACAIGTTYKGKPVGGLADVGCFSFHPRKIVTTGEGGAVTTKDDESPKWFARGVITVQPGRKLRRAKHEGRGRCRHSIGSDTTFDFLIFKQPSVSRRWRSSTVFWQSAGGWRPAIARD